MYSNEYNVDELKLEKLGFFETFSFVKLYKYNRLPNEVENYLIEFLDKPKLKLFHDDYVMTFLSKEVKVDFWISNKFYAYCSHISIVDNTNNESIKYESIYVSKKLKRKVYAIEKALKKKIREDEIKKVKNILHVK